ncbi:MAG: transcriptional regulator [Deltaproteobacteria bacterium]|nr:transcriptional regulator [Nannocystaceae bacterium]
MSALDDTFTALADPTRRAVVELLRRRPQRAGELAVALEMSPPALSRHLKVLRQSGLVLEQRDAEDARARVYRLEPAPFDALRRWLADVESFWQRELDAFKQHAERTRGRARR